MVEPVVHLGSEGIAANKCLFQTTKLLVERLRAWKHVCGNLEDFISVTAKVSKSQSKDYEKIMKVGFWL